MKPQKKVEPPTEDGSKNQHNSDTSTVAPSSDEGPITGTVRGYRRVSSSAQDEERQRRVLASLIDQYYTDWPVEWYIEDGVSAYHVSAFDRPEMKRLLADLGPGDIVVADDQDRLSRGEEKEQLALKLYIKNERKATIHTAAQGIVGDDFADGLIWYVKGYLARLESETKARRIRDKKAQLLADGYYGGGDPPFGTRIVGEKYHKVLEATDDIATVILAFELIAAGHGPNSAARQLGLGRSRLTKRILQNRHYVGEVQHRAVWHPAKWPAFVDRALFERVQMKLAANRGADFRSAPTQPFGTILRCGQCDKLLRVNHGSKKAYRYYTCRTDEGGCGLTIPVENLEGNSAPYAEAIRRDLLNDLNTGDWLNVWRSQHDADQLRAQLAELEASAARLAEGAATGGIVGEKMAEKLPAINQEHAELTRDLLEATQGRAAAEAELHNLAAHSPRSANPSSGSGIPRP